MIDPYKVPALKWTLLYLAASGCDVQAYLDCPDEYLTWLTEYLFIHGVIR